MREREHSQTNPDKEKTFSSHADCPHFVALGLHELGLCGDLARVNGTAGRLGGGGRALEVGLVVLEALYILCTCRRLSITSSSLLSHIYVHVYTCTQLMCTLLPAPLSCERVRM